MDGKASERPSRSDLRDWLGLIRAEYSEVPGLSLTRQQIKRLWDLDDVLCDALLEALEASRFLRRTEHATYVRAA
jgi:hypothetical protein